jgi:voltage-gated sodium channel
MLPTALEQMNAEFSEDLEKYKNHIAAKPQFNLVVTVLIVLNMVLVGIEVDYARGDTLEDRMVFFLLDFLFMVAFFIEMLIKLGWLGWDYFIDPWNVFDYALVVLNVCDIVVSVTSQPSQAMRLASIFRALRLMRVVRNIKGLKVFYGLWMILQGMLDSLRTLGWMILLLLMILYIAAVTLASVVGQSEFARERWRYSDQYVGSVWKSMWTVIQILTLDNWATDIGRPMGEVSPFSLCVAILAVVVCSFGVLNIIVAVMVERMQNIALESKEMTSKVLEKTEHALLCSMADEFKAAELDESGEVTLEEFRKMLTVPSMTFKLRLLGLMAQEAESLFEIMDADNSGSVSPEEFVTGLQKLKGVAKGQDLVQLICFAQKTCMRASVYVDRLKELNKKADIIQDRLNVVGKGMSHELKDRDASAARNEDVWAKAAERTGVIGILDKSRQLQFPSLPERY